MWKGGMMMMVGMRDGMRDGMRMVVDWDVEGLLTYWWIEGRDEDGGELGCEGLLTYWWIEPSSGRLQTGCCQYQRSKKKEKTNRYQRPSHQEKKKKKPFGDMGEITYRINPLQKCPPKNVKGQIPSRLDPPICVIVSRIGVRQIRLSDGKFLVAHGQLHRGKLIQRRVGRKHISRRIHIVKCTRNRAVDGIAHRIINQRQRTPRVGHGGVVEARNFSIGNGRRRALKLPQPLRIVHRGVVNLLAAERPLVDPAKGVKRLPKRRIGIPVRIEIGGEQLPRHRNGSLGDDGLGKRRRRKRCDFVDRPKGETK